MAAELLICSYATADGSGGEGTAAVSRVVGGECGGVGGAVEDGVVLVLAGVGCYGVLTHDAWVVLATRGGE